MLLLSQPCSYVRVYNDPQRLTAHRMTIKYCTTLMLKAIEFDNAAGDINITLYYSDDVMAW